MPGMFATSFNQHVLASTLKQAGFMERYGPLEWDYASKTGKLTFGRRTVLQSEILGTYSKDSGTWLWAWANRYSPLPDERTRISRGLRQFGSDKKIAELTAGEFPVTQEMNPHLLGLLAIGLANLPCYFLANHEHGAMLMAITTPDCNPLPTLDNLQTINHISNVIGQIPVTSHRDAVIGFCAALKWKGEDHGSSLVIRNPTQREAIELTIDAQQRITGLTTRVVEAKS
jgi:hypothetical protein